MKKPIGYATINGVKKVPVFDYKLQCNRLNQLIPNTPIECKVKDGSWVVIDGQELWEFA